MMYPKILCFLVVLLSSLAFSEGKDDYASTILGIAHDIEMLKEQYPQLKAFSVTDNVDLATLSITYRLNTHKPERRGGWTSGVPNPDANGIWFYIDIHDPDSTRQIHTQPATISMSLGDKRVTYLILEGAETKSVSAAIWKILSNHGVTTKLRGAP